jgi:hypothetical protein
MLIAIILGGIVLAAVLAVLALMYLPALDERLGFFTGRDLRRFLDHEVGGATVATLVASRGGAAVWRATHRDWIDETEIECTLEGGVRCCWTFSHGPPRPWLVRQSYYVTPTNRHAARLIPELLPGNLKPGVFAEQPWGSGVAYDMAEPTKAREWLEPFLRKKLPQLFVDDQRR